jgi:hypothetical protein
VRRILSLVLLFTFGFPLVAPALALSQTADSNLPACCRRNGAHHCMMSTEQTAALLNGNHFTSIRSKCPFCPTTSPTSQHNQLGFQAIDSRLSNLIAYPAKYSQVEARARATEIAVRQSRGPPQDLL